MLHHPRFDSLSYHAYEEGHYSFVALSITYLLYIARELVERQNGKRGLESGFGSAGYVNEI